MHLEDLKAQTIAQKAALSSFKTSMENSKKLEIEMINQAHQNQIELAKQEAEQIFYIEIDKLKQENEQEMLTLRVELERAIEISHSKEREAEIKADEYQQEMRMKQKLIEKFTEEVKELKTSNTDLQNENELKVKEMKRVKQELQIEYR
jgi:hypothetical protein